MEARVLVRPSFKRIIKKKYLMISQQPMNKLYAISDDGSGNPILMDQQGYIFIYYHDSWEMEMLYESLDSLFKETLLGE